MSTHLDFDLSELEAARDEVATAIVDLVTMGVERGPDVRDETTNLIFRLGSAHLTLVRAIDVCGGPTIETP